MAKSAKAKRSYPKGTIELLIQSWNQDVVIDKFYASNFHPKKELKRQLRLVKAGELPELDRPLYILRVIPKGVKHVEG